MPRSFLDGKANWFPDGMLAELPDIAADPDRYRVLGWELEPGDAVCFHMLTLHGAGGVDGPDRRRVLSLRFLGDDMVHAPRRWTTSPPFPGLEDELAAGAALDHPLFPIVWIAPGLTRGVGRASARQRERRPDRLAARERSDPPVGGDPVDDDQAETTDP